MAAVAAIAGVGLMIVCSSSLAAALMMGGEEETPAPATTTPAGPSAGPTASDDTGVTSQQPLTVHECVQSERNWINGKMRNDGWTQLQGEEAMSCRMTDTEIRPCNAAEMTWINSVVQSGQRSPGQAEREKGCRRV